MYMNILDLPLDIKKTFKDYLYYDDLTMEYFKFLHKGEYANVINEFKFFFLCYENNVDIYDNTWRSIGGLRVRPYISWQNFPSYVLFYRRENDV